MVYIGWWLVDNTHFCRWGKQLLGSLPTTYDVRHTSVHELHPHESRQLLGQKGYWNDHLECSCKRLRITVHTILRCILGIPSLKCKCVILCHSILFLVDPCISTLAGDYIPIVRSLGCACIAFCCSVHEIPVIARTTILDEISSSDRLRVCII